MYDHLEHIFFIDQYGIGLNENGDEYRDEEGLIFLVPENLQKNFKTIERD